MKTPLRAALLAACATLAMAGGAARPAEVPLVTGEPWTQSTTEVKKVYLIGIANTLQLESAYQGTTPPGDNQSAIPRFSKGLKGQTLDSVRQRVHTGCRRQPLGHGRHHIPAGMADARPDVH